MAEHRAPTIKINQHDSLRVSTLSADAEYLLGGTLEEVQVWRVKDGAEVASLKVDNVPWSLAISSGGRWIAAGTFEGYTLVWDTETHEQVFAHREHDTIVLCVDFSPDGTRFVSASSNGIAVIFNLATQKQTQTFPCDGLIIAAKFAPQGDWIATATANSVRVWDSNNGRLLADIPVKVAPFLNNGLVWLNDHLLVVSGEKIKQIEISTGSVVSEWPVSGSDTPSYIALPKSREFIAYSTRNTVTFWDPETHIQLGLFRHTEDIVSIAFSPDGRSIVIGGAAEKITTYHLSGPIPLFCLHHAMQELDMQIDDDILDCWMNNRLEDAEALLTGVISANKPNYHLLANRALVRAHLGRWHNAIVDARESLEIQPSTIGYIATSVALVGNGEKYKAYRACDIALWRIHSKDDPFLLLIKAIIIFMAGEHKDAIPRIDDLIRVVSSTSTCYAVQSYMLLLLANSCMENRDYSSAVQYLERARCEVQSITNVMLPISLISGWTFDDLGVTIQQRLCEALYAAGRAREAGESLMMMIDVMQEDVNRMTPITAWVSDFLERYLSTSESRDNESFYSLTSMPLLREWVKSKLTGSTWKEALASALNFSAPRIMIYQVLCDHLEMTDRVTEAVECFHQIDSELVEDTSMHGGRKEWAVDFTRRCARKLERFGDMATQAQQHDAAIAQYSTALSLGSVNPRNVLMKRSKAYMAKRSWEDAIGDANQAVAIDPSTSWGNEQVLVEWAKVELTGGGWKNALQAAHGFEVTMFSLYRTLCERLENLMRTTDAIECLQEMVHNLAHEADGKQMKWIDDFKYGCSQKLEYFGDAAAGAERFAKAISWYSTALSLNPTAPQSLLVKRSKAHAAMKSWQGALDDANEVIALDPSPPSGYERRYIALRGTGDYGDAISAFEMMLSAMLQSSDPEDCARHRKYEETKAAIRTAIKNATRKSPPRLINTDSGQLLDKSAQEQSFELEPAFLELISSATTPIDYPRIEREVADYYRYAMFSHKWERSGEPLFEKIVQIVVYDLEVTLTHDKLKMFCKIARGLGLHWAWSDTCCINKADHFELQEALVLMFQWYEGGAITVVSLSGVRSPSKRGDLTKSIWNTRIWTYQEYHASKVVRFYTEDWEPYLDMSIWNHKESPEVITEMEEATGVSARALMALRPGLENIREKLRLASTRHTTRMEDEAYALLGMFSMSLPVVYGEGDKSFGRFLAQLLTSSGDRSILAWMGRAGSFNSCLPSNIIAFSQLPTTHVPQPLESTEMDEIIPRLQRSSLSSLSLITLHDRLHALPVPWFVGQRMKLPCIVSKLGPLTVYRGSSRKVFRAQTSLFGIVEVRTGENLARLSSLYLVHPWIDFLLDRGPVASVEERMPMDDTADQESFSSDDSSGVELATAKLQTSGLFGRLGRLVNGPHAATAGDEAPLRPPSPLSLRDKQTNALKILARLRRPFGALLLTQGNTAYRRVAAESVITVQIEEITQRILKVLVDSIDTLDVL